MKLPAGSAHLSVLSEMNSPYPGTAGKMKILNYLISNDFRNNKLFLNQKVLKLLINTSTLAYPTV